MPATGRSKFGVFISYARADGDVAAHDLHARLAVDAPELGAWLDRHELEGGVGWWKQIEAQIERAEFLLLVMTPAAMRSDNTRREWRAARQQGVCVYPVKGAGDAALDFSVLPGWMRRAHFYDLDREWPALLAHLRRGCLAPRVPFMAPPLPVGFVPREAMLARATAAVAADEPGPAPVVVLRAPGGFGKTTLAAAACQAEAVIDRYDDGVLWVTLGQKPQLQQELLKLYAALTGERPGFVDIEDATRELALRLEDRHCLIVIDDVWNADHLRPFLRGAPQCARLVTTRVFDVALQGQRIDVDALTPHEGVQLLQARLGAPTADAASLAALVERVGAWPLALKLVASALRARIERGETPGRALAHVHHALDRRGITAFDDPGADERGSAVARSVEASLGLLDTTQQQRCAELAVFPEDKAIPLSVVCSLWQLDPFDAEELARRLDELALVEFDLRQGTLRLHDVLRSYMAHRLGGSAPVVHARLLDAWDDPYTLPEAAAWRFFSHHLAGAGRRDALRTLLLDARWISRRLEATDVQSLVGDFALAPADRALELVRDALQLSAPVLAADPRQLASQLIGRLLDRREPELRALGDALAALQDGCWLHPLLGALDAPGGRLRMTLVGHQNAISGLTVDGGWTVLVSAGRRLRVWDAAQGRELAVFGRTGLGIGAVAISADGGTLLAGGADGVFELWDLPRRQRTNRFTGDDRRAVRALAMSADARTAVVAGRGGGLHVWDLDARQVRCVLHGHGDAVRCVAITPDGALAVSGADDGGVCLWDLATGALARRLPDHPGAVGAVALAGDGRHLITGCADGVVRWWAVGEGTCRFALRGHTAAVTTLALAEGAAHAISGSADHTLRHWDLASGECLGTLAGHNDTVSAVVVDAQGRRAASASPDRTVKLWQLDRPARSAEPVCHGAPVDTLAFAPDGATFASAAADGSIMVRRVADGSVVRAIAPHAVPLRSVCFTADGAAVLGFGFGSRQALWFVDTGEGVRLPVRHTAPVDHAVLPASARYLVTACADRTLSVWDMPSGVLLARYATRRVFDDLVVASPRRAELAPNDDRLDSWLPGEIVLAVTAIAVSPGGGQVVVAASAAATGSVRAADHAAGPASAIAVIEIATAGVRTVLPGRSGPIHRVAVDDAGLRVAWTRADHSLEWADLETGARTVLRGHSEAVQALVLSADGRLLASAGRDACVIVWDPAAGRALARFGADAALHALALSPRERLIAAGDHAGRVHLLRLQGVPPSL